MYISIFEYLNIAIINLFSHLSDDYITIVKSGWNIVSISYDLPISKTDVLVNDTIWSDTVVVGLIDDNMFGWDSTFQSYNLATIINPGDSYWLIR